MTSWTDFHKLAEEVHLWSDLIVNLWIIMTAIFLATIRYAKRAAVTPILILDAAVWALIFIFWTSIATFVVGVVISSHSLILWSLIALSTYIVVVGAMLLSEWIRGRGGKNP